jgi:hypothetical protein
MLTVYLPGLNDGFAGLVDTFLDTHSKSPQLVAAQVRITCNLAACCTVDGSLSVGCRLCMCMFWQ